jgi:hypothetical protein
LSTRTGEVRGLICGTGTETARFSSVGAANNGFAGRGAISDEILNVEGSFCGTGGGFGGETAGIVGGGFFGDLNGKTGNLIGLVFVGLV